MIDRFIVKQDDHGEFYMHDRRTGTDTRGANPPVISRNRAEIEELADQSNRYDAHTWGTLAYVPHGQEKIRHLTGDIIFRQGARGTQYAQVYQGGAVPAIDQEQIVAVLYGTTVTGRDGDLAGWTPDRHRELRAAVAGDPVPYWFVTFLFQHGLGHQIPAPNPLPHRRVRVVTNDQATWLLERWDEEHPPAAGDQMDEKEGA